VVPLEPEPRFSEYAAMFNEVRRHI
jgi:hypothetical protein